MYLGAACSNFPLGAFYAKLQQIKGGFDFPCPLKIIFRFNFKAL